MNQYSYILLAIGVASLIGFIAAIHYGRKRRSFLWSEYIALIAVPIICCFILMYFYGVKIATLFMYSAFSGLILEYGVGRAYHKTTHKRLWTYDRLNISGYTSWLSVPMWGIAGIVFWLLSKSVGL